MSLSSFLLGKRRSKGDKHIDGDLDALLRSSSDDEEADEGPEEADKQNIEKQPSATPEGEEDTSQLAHETTAKKGRHSQTRSRHAHQVPPDETKERRDARTMFLGNVPVEACKEQGTHQMPRDLKRHILSHVPGAKIESMRFRSVAFQRPTSAPPAPRAHSLERTAEWRASKGDEASAPQPRLGPSDKKRAAFIMHELHADAAAVTAYRTLLPTSPRGVPLPRSTIRNTWATPCARTPQEAVQAIPKRTIFVGSLDFASREEDLRTFFEGVVSAELGPRTAVAGGSDEDEEDTGDPNAHGSDPKTWVTRVRIVRDKDTQLGKGFAYVQFADRECVDEVLALESDKLKFAKRKLRVERLLARLRSPYPRPVPKGNPNLGAQLAHLSKADRKAAKAIDAERVARRLAKKRARSALKVPEQRKDRVRVRKISAEHKGASAITRQKKSRARSERSMARQNTKK
ncbi:hypothetical protein F5148DRAFT_1300950 [Russula earlei]|uniref:Uncharacterized protein n=1 Tax=Russula earlei TaxID=71964 RepID=A0ACC0TY40_9AGAM|nr:hypothetical protein F5148DRAFT_1300950 [Russula earlei]